MTTERGGTRQGELSIGDTDVPAEGWVRDLITKVATQCLQESSDILIHIAQTVVQIAEKRLQSQLDDLQSQIKAQDMEEVANCIIKETERTQQQRNLTQQLEAHKQQVSLLTEEIRVSNHRLSRTEKQLRELQKKINQAEEDSLMFPCQDREINHQNSGMIGKHHSDSNAPSPRKKMLNLLVVGLHSTRATVDGVHQLFTSRMGCELTEEDIASVQFLGNNRSNQPMTIVRFNSLSARQRVYKRRIALKGANGIWLNEDLSSLAEKLHFMARQLYRAGTIAGNWTFNGQVYIKLSIDGRAIQILSQDDLDRVTTRTSDDDNYNSDDDTNQSD